MSGVRRLAAVWSTRTLPVSTRAQLSRIGLRRAAERWLPALRRLPRGDVGLRVGDGRTWLVGATRDVDYLTFCEVFVDEIFPVIAAGRVVLDVGAHRGYFGCYALARGAAVVHSFEPYDEHVASLARTAGTYRRGTWHVHRHAVRDRDGVAELNVSAESWSHSLITPVSGGVVGVQSVPVKAFAPILRHVAARAAGREIVVKLNIEGVAGDVILATPVQEWERVSELVFDHEPGTPQSIDTLFAHLARAGLVPAGRVGRNHRLVRVPTDRLWDRTQ